jgi:hypothetical protein
VLHSAKGRFLSGVHTVVGALALAANAIAAAWGGTAWARGNPSTTFWPILRVAQALVVIEVVLGGVLLAMGKHVPDNLHLFYGVAPLVVNVIAEGARVGAAQAELEEVDDFEALERKAQILLARRIVMREIGIMTIGSLMTLTLLLRAAQFL